MARPVFDDRNPGKASSGRRAAAYFGNPIHGAVVGRPGAKLRASANEFTPAYAGAMGGTLLGGKVGARVGGKKGALLGTSLGQLTGAVGGNSWGVTRNQRQGYYKPEKKVHKAFASRDQNSGGLSSMTARTPSGKYVSHENDLVVVHVSPRHAKNSSKLEHYTGGHSGRLVTHVVKGLLGPPGTGATVVSHHTVRQGSKLGVYGRSHGSKLVTHVGKAAAPFENHRLIPGNESYNSLRAGEDAWSRGPKGPKDYSGGYGRPAVRSSSAARSATVLPTKKVGGLASLARKARLR